MSKAVLIKGKEEESAESPSYDYGTPLFQVKSDDLFTEDEDQSLCEADYHVCCAPTEDLDCQSNGFKCTSNSQCLDQNQGDTSASKYTCPNNEEICCRNYKPPDQKPCSRRRGASCVNSDQCPSGVKVFDDLSCPVDG